MNNQNISDSWSYDGIKTVILDHKDFLAIFLPEIGGIMWKLIYKKNWTNLLYNHKEPSVYGSMISSYSKKDPIHDYFIGGWFEVLPNGGYEYSSDTYGPFYDLHSETPYLPWKYKIDGERLIMNVKLLRVPLRLEREISFISNGLKITENLMNFGKTNIKFSWLHHPCLDLRVFSGSKIALVSNRLEVDKYFIHDYRKFMPGYNGKWPFVKSINNENFDLSSIHYKEMENFTDTVYLEMKEGWYDIMSVSLGLKFTIKWDKNIFPYVWFWIANGGGGYPWYGTASTLSLEFSSSYPATGLSSQIKNKTALSLDGGESISTTIFLTFDDLTEA